MEMVKEARGDQHGLQQRHHDRPVPRRTQLQRNRRQRLGARHRLRPVDGDHSEELEGVEELLIESSTKGPSRSLAYHAYTLWLFTRSNIKTMILPATVFGLATTLSGPLLTTNASPDYYNILCRLPLVILSTWMELLVFDLSNQRQPGSAVEDAVNKPWRPIPSGRISEAAARHLLMAAIPATIIKSILLGTTLETLVFFILTWIYNDLAASESHYLIRTLINALGISTYSASAAAVAARITPTTTSTTLPLHTYTLPLGPDHLSITTPLTPRFYHWLLLLSLAIFLTITTQDLPDLPGDAAKGRPSMPLAIGEARARWSIAAGFVGASAACCAFWGTGWIGVLGTGIVLAGRAVAARGVEWDKGTWRGWCGWVAVVYCLPVWARWRGVV